MQIEQLTTELANEKSNSQKSENGRALLERQNKELKAKLAEIETAQRTKVKATIATLEAKIANLEEQLENEGKERLLQLKANRKMDKKIKELTMNIEDERRHVDQHKEQMDKLNSRIKLLKRNLDEGENVSNFDGSTMIYFFRSALIFSTDKLIQRRVHIPRSI
ncbi:myosin heavy chain, non-muscle-like [Drosophila subobscura]|uniref:myosin heavy chain, non-muscle-like n=1 Tax=Drosophila subobscura TaxID=7241 RepID=UPI00155AE3A0|nr:myosin heavy chain, non-muscle-like [Drosophila subobscura]